MNKLIQKGYFRALPEAEQRELWNDNLTKYGIREHHSQPAYYQPELPAAEPSYNDRAEAMRKERESLTAERQKLVEQFRKQEEERNMLHEAKNRSETIEKNILSKITAAERDTIISEFVWDKFTAYPSKVLYVKREAILGQKRKGEKDLEQWFAEIREWEKKNENNFEDQLKGIIDFSILT